MRTLISEKLRDVLLNKKATLELYENLIDKHKEMQPLSSNTPSSYGRVQNKFDQETDREIKVSKDTDSQCKSI
ncbi:hypothetical protein [Legionella longbeachae]|uniref:hypothetical protein n=1 Tax=Legionella longbeachae TaxID=450 RepID=UPI0014052EFA|nr:hypothetical protein [Legionella longbeachae]QIN37127.1 hypothetical protein GCS73_16590 [Legionella longbeachae]